MHRHDPIALILLDYQIDNVAVGLARLDLNILRTGSAVGW
jgi:hypothetical protein